MISSLVRVSVEFFGIPRARAGTRTLELQLPAPATLGDALRALGERFPGLAQECIEKEGLRAGYTVNLGGERFVDSPSTSLVDGSSLLIMSADAGG